MNASAKSVHEKILAWFDREGRKLPWRASRDPYRIWISEIMLQQTRVETVIPYYERFLSHFPDVQALASAPLDKVTNLWAGLGYYSRARNLHKAAGMVLAKFGGKMPGTFVDLRNLPGIGEYTAAAIASIAYGEEAAAVDGNLERVLSRLLAEKRNPKKEGRRAIRKLAEELVSYGRPGDINQALMDLSSMLCAPKNPRCGECPLHAHCKASEMKLTANIPFREKKKKKVELKATGVLLLDGDRVLVGRRPSGSWLQGMWDLPWTTEGEIELPGSWRTFGKHESIRTITHHKIIFTVRFFKATKPNPEALRRRLSPIASELRWVKLAELHGIHLPRPSEKALAAAIEALNS